VLQFDEMGSFIFGYLLQVNCTLFLLSLIPTKKRILCILSLQASYSPEYLLKTVSYVIYPSCYFLTISTSLALL